MLRHMKISYKLYLGFSLLILIITCIFRGSYLANEQALDRMKRTDDIQEPSVIASSQAQIDLFHMFGYMRSYLTLGEEQFQKSYYQTEQKFQSDLKHLETFSQDPHSFNREHLDEIQHAFDEWSVLSKELFALYDEKMVREPAYAWLGTTGMGFAKDILSNIDQIIQEQSERPPSLEGNQLLKDMQKFQVSFMAVFSGLRSYVMTREPKFRYYEYEVNLAINENIWKNLLQRKLRFTRHQQLLLEQVNVDRRNFLALVSPNVLDIMQSDEWRKDWHLFKTKAIPMMEHMQQLLDKMVVNQQIILQKDLNQGKSDLEHIQKQTIYGGLWIMLFVVTMIYLLTTQVLQPIHRLTVVATKIQHGDFQITAPVDSRDEIGIFAQTFNDMTRQLYQLIQEHKRTEEEIRRINIELEERVLKRTELLNMSNAELEKLNQQLRSSHDVLSTLIHGLEDGLVLLDDTGNILMSNYALSHLIGIKPDVLLNRDWADVCEQMTPVFPGQEALRSLHERKHRTYREVYTTADGQEHILDIKSIPLLEGKQLLLDGKESLCRLIIHIVDVTERFHLEARLIQNERFATSGRIAATVAHEVNTPLQAIQGLFYLLRQAQESEREAYIASANAEIGRIGRILRQLLDHCTTRDNSTIIMVDINKIIEGVILLISGSLAKHNIILQHHLMEHIPLIAGRPDEFTQVFMNLFLNAVEAMPNGGKLSVQTNVVQNIHLTECREFEQRNKGKQFLTIEICDSGGGIPAEVQKRIFDPFFTTKKHCGGTGLGLAVSQKIVHQYQGYINVTSELGYGTTFTLFFPLEDDEKDALPSP